MSDDSHHFRDAVLERDTFNTTYPDGLTLMRELRAIGATNADSSRQRTLTGKSHLRAVHDAYETFVATACYPQPTKSSTPALLHLMQDSLVAHPAVAISPASPSIAFGGVGAAFDPFIANRA